MSLYGDKDRARRLERKARIRVGYLFDQLRPGQTYRTDNRRLNDGSIIKIAVWRDILGERASVKIFATTGKIISIEPGSLWSGLADPSWEVWVDPALRGPTTWVGKNIDSVWSFQSFSPEGVSIGLAGEAEKPERIMFTSKIGAVPYQNIEQYSNTNLPSSYTGKMRKIVQRMLGAGQVCWWRSRWNDSAWCYTTEDEVDWVIHFSSVYGLCAAKIEYEQIGQEKVAVGPDPNINRTKWTELIAVGDLSSYLDDTYPMSFDIGFACNTKGDQARNISTRPYNITPDGLAHSHEWLVTITEGLVDGEYEPISATLTEVSDTPVWCGTRGGLRVPNGALLSQVIEWGDPENANNPPKPSGQNIFKWPIFVFYKGDEVQRYYMHFDYDERTVVEDPEPRGATDADVWKSDGYDPYPYTGSYPVSGEGEFALGSSILFRNKKYFSGPGVDDQSDQSWSGGSTGADTFVLEQVDDASGTLVPLGVSGSNYVFGGGAVYAAVRYRTEVVASPSHSVSYAAWIPNGDRESILFLRRAVDYAAAWRYLRRVRYGHMFVSGGIEVVPAGDIAPCCASGAIIQKIGGTTASRPQLPSPVDLATMYSGGWNTPNGTCPLPYYQMPYICQEQESGKIFHTSSYDEQLSIDPAPDPTGEWEVSICSSSGVSGTIDSDNTPTVPDSTWLAIGVIDPYPSPLYVNLTYNKNGIYQAFPGVSHIKTTGNVDPAYLGLFKEKGPACLWVGEPEIN